LCDGRVCYPASFMGMSVSQHYRCQLLLMSLFMAERPHVDAVQNPDSY
jgi:hypothetical protein